MRSLHKVIQLLVHLLTFAKKCRFSLNQLPSWAAKRLAPNYENASGDQKPQLPKGRWAQRFIQAPSVNFDTEGSVDSGIESNRNLDEEKTLRIEEYLQRNAEYSGEQYRFDDVVEDLSDNEKNNSKVYYLQSESFNRSEFPVTAIDKDLLRKSVRRKNRDNFLQVMSANPQATDNDELEDYDDDDDIVSNKPLKIAILSWVGRIYRSSQISNNFYSVVTYLDKS